MDATGPMIGAAVVAGLIGYSMGQSQGVDSERERTRVQQASRSSPAEECEDSFYWVLEGGLDLSVAQLGFNPQAASDAIANACYDWYDYQYPLDLRGP